MGEINYEAFGETFTDLYELYQYMGYEKHFEADLTCFYPKYLRMTITYEALRSYLGLI